jgi:hypothetical protein
VQWDTKWIPDQIANENIKLIARIKDTSGIWYVTDQVINLSLLRSGWSVKMYKPEKIPAEYIARGRTAIGSSFTIPAGDAPSSADEARLVMRRWNGDNHKVGTITSLNTYRDSIPGASYYYDIISYKVPVSSVISGENTFSFLSNVPQTHGIEFMWPGPAMKLGFGSIPTGVRISNDKHVQQKHPLKCYPNPFKEKISIVVEAEEFNECLISVFTLTGIKVFEKEIQNPGSTTTHIEWDGCSQNGSRLASGSYVVLIRTPQNSWNSKIFLSR